MLYPLSATTSAVTTSDTDFITAILTMSYLQSRAVTFTLIEECEGSPGILFSELTETGSVIYDQFVSLPPLSTNCTAN